MYQARSGGVGQKLGSGVMVAAIQIGIGAALLTTFAGGGMRVIIDPPKPQPTWASVPPPPPQRVERQHRHTKDPTDPVAKSSTESIPTLPIDIILGPLAGDLKNADGDGGPVAEPPMPVTKVPPVAARPIGDQGQWIRPNDYPLRALQENWSGVTRLHLVIGADGRVSACSITASSGHDQLDRVACAKLTERARFSPARNADGTGREGSFDTAIRWEIQDII